MLYQDVAGGADHSHQRDQRDCERESAGWAHPFESAEILVHICNKPENSGQGLHAALEMEMHGKSL